MCPRAPVSKQKSSSCSSSVCTSQWELKFRQDQLSEHGVAAVACDHGLHRSQVVARAAAEEYTRTDRPMDLGAQVEVVVMDPCAHGPLCPSSSDGMQVKVVVIDCCAHGLVCPSGSNEALCSHGPLCPSSGLSNGPLCPWAFVLQRMNIGCTCVVVNMGAAGRWWALRHVFAFFERGKRVGVDGETFPADDLSPPLHQLPLPPALAVAKPLPKASIHIAIRTSVQLLLQQDLRSEP